MTATAPIPAPRVLVVDDHRKIREPLAVYLRRHAFDVRTAESAEGMWQLLEVQHFDVIVLDVMLPDGDGFELCSRLYRRNGVPVILLTARDTTSDRIRGLDLGADDYLSKPFEPRELVARINSVLRRRGASRVEPAAVEPAPRPLLRHYQFAGLVFASGTGSLSAGNGQCVRLSTAQGRLLQVFLEHPHQVLDRARLIDLTARPDSDVFDRTIDRQVSRLRRRLADGAGRDDLLRTVWGGGYMLVADVTLLAS
ncbi:response regulator [Phytopseudomonas dryadis]|uniref:DNA-binding response regulator n=1 Tax=Phytopseudomonas dryadis TaxID=2487520 RepID=A0A4Q9R520_9GAMM|nr:MULTISPECIES: response regulator transcription factor [Pseudomonas]TBU94418.1 DNA-binding response regulator [Pseudomonas dryadis]TBU99550.1 DNA-binding response regulator [Pseudomonas dryadis]TBV12647.1 DNA-binding response regulator [Pseudomonas sp. FRB 230]